MQLCVTPITTARVTHCITRNTLTARDLEAHMEVRVFEKLEINEFFLELFLYTIYTEEMPEFPPPAPMAIAFSPSLLAFELNMHPL